jgi:hypothetical protein
VNDKIMRRNEIKAKMDLYKALFQTALGSFSAIFIVGAVFEKAFAFSFLEYLLLFVCFITAMVWIAKKYLWLATELDREEEK